MEVPVATEVELTLHHVKKDGNCCFPQLRLWDQGHLQDWPHHCWDEFYFVGTCKKFKVKYIQWQDLDFQCLSTLFTQQTAQNVNFMWLLLKAELTGYSSKIQEQPKEIIELNCESQKRLSEKSHSSFTWHNIL